MADKSSGAGSVLKNPVIPIMVVVLLALIAGFAGNYYFVRQDSVQLSGYLGYANKLKVLSQEIAKHALSASQGNAAIYPTLTESKNQFDSELGFLRNGNPVANLPASDAASQGQLRDIATLWGDIKANVDVILANKEALMYLRDISADLSITMSAIQAENNKVVAAMLRLPAPASEVALAQRQSVLIERMSHSIDKVLERGTTKSLSSNLNRDSDTFLGVLNGLTNGDKDLLLTAATDTEIQSSLTKIEELFRSVSARVNEILTRSQDVVEINTAADAIYEGSSDLMRASDGLISSYRSGSGQGLASPALGLGFVVGSLFVFLVISFMIYRQASQSSGETERTNEENQAAILQLLDELADLADGDLRVQATVTESFTGAIADSINFSIDQMRALVSKINETSVNVSNVADHTQKSVQELTQASQRQSNEISDVSEAVNEMAVSIDMVSCNAAESSTVAGRSVGIANKGASVVQNTIDGMDTIRGQIQETAKRIKRLGESSQEIGDIVALINDIADQTNILSLNAAIQASMAGDAGKGFAVVADEVQRLAERSGAAAKQISALVKTIQSDTNEAVSSMEQTTTEVVQGTRLAQDAGVALGEIESVSKSLAEIIENISDAARQQAASAGKISNTLKSIQEISSQTSNGAKSTATAVGGLAETTNELRASVTSFKLPE
ncbi:MAG: chemotaxis protein [Gammaproteobacteria bacterium]|jgi:twitching motility protein PilJ|nr:chemotaxis protein [Gammaproteobacteria bacterium]|tara:strand:+ start:251 stop:2275 length:2025 start_codon:yes stop_codon:yes gene_type:complete